MADEIKTLEKQETLQPSLLHQGISGAMSDFAKADSFISDLGIQVAENASTRMNQILGYEAGKNPTKEPFIPITNAGKVYEQSYNASAYQHAASQLYESSFSQQLELAKLPKITDGHIAQLAESLIATKNELYENIPDSIKPQLDKTFNDNLAHTVQNLELKKAQQDLKDAHQKLVSDNKSSSINIANLALSGNYEAAVNLSEATSKTNQQLVDAQRMSEQDKANIDQTNFTNLYANHLTFGARDALQLEKNDPIKNKGLFGDYVAGMGLILDSYKVPPITQIGIIKKALANIKQDDQTRKKQNNDALTEYKIDVNQGTDSPESLTQIEKNNGTAVADSATLYKSTHSAKQNKIVDQIRSLRADKTPNNFVKMTGDIKDKAAIEEINEKVKKDKDFDNAVISTAISYPGPIPYINKLINTKINSTNPAEIESGILIYDGISASEPTLVDGVSTKTVGRMAKYQQEYDDTQNRNQAAINTAEAYKDKDEEEMKRINSSWAEISKQKFRSNASRSKLTAEALNDSWGKTILNQQLASSELERFTKQIFAQNNGDFDSALKGAQTKLRMTWGLDTTNTGTSSAPFVEHGYITKRPIQEAFKIGTENPGIMQSFLVDHTKDMLARINAVSKDVKFRLAKRNVSLDEALEAREKVKEIKSKSFLRLFSIKQRDELVAAQSKIDAFNKGQDLEIYKIMPDGTRSKYSVYLSPPTVMTESDKVKGGWNIMLRDDKGNSSTLNSISGQNFLPPVELNINDVQSRYLNLTGTESKSLSPAEEIARMKREEDYQERLSKAKFQVGL